MSKSESFFHPRDHLKTFAHLANASKNVNKLDKDLYSEN